MSCFSPASYSLFSINQKAPFEMQVLPVSPLTQILSLPVRPRALPRTTSRPFTPALIHPAPVTPASSVFLQQIRRASASGFHLCSPLCLSSLFFLKVYLFILRERERKGAHAGRGGAEREGERESQAGSTLLAQPDVGLDPTNHEILT